MSSLENHEAYRFVVIYRKEPREIRDAESQWRGTLVPVPDNGNADNEQRRAFSDLDELPELIRSFIRQRRADVEAQPAGNS